ncbi:MAG: YqiA/YcfP family alpha/beta fold hydrolase [Acidobacteriota bacterium]
MQKNRDVVYLHGFASSPQSNKAQFFSQKLREEGVRVDVPRLDGGDFEKLSISSQLEIVDQTVAGGEVMLMGSSMGGYLAALYAARHANVESLVLLAPGFQFPSLWRKRYPPEELARWKQEGSVPIFHYGEKREMRLGYQLMEDSAQYEGEPEVRQPTLIFHGTRDEVVPYSVSEEFAAQRPNATLHLMESGHELTDVLESMWVKVQVFRKSL